MAKNKNNTKEPADSPAQADTEAVSSVKYRCIRSCGVGKNYHRRGSVVDFDASGNANFVRA